jgi:hypothetical protein
MRIMKNIALTVMVFAGVLTGCSNDDQTVFNENGNENDFGVQSTQTLEICADADALGGSATLSSYTGPQITFNWNNEVTYSADMTYVSYIEIAEDPTCPAPAGAAAVPATYPIDVFNTSSLMIAGVSSKCFYWRIVINGYVNSVLECNTTTEWKDATYVQ